MNSFEEIRAEIQESAHQALKKNDYYGSIVLPTGLGKTFVVFKCIKELYDMGQLRDGDDLYFCAERVKREKTFDDNLAEYKRIFDFDIQSIFNVIFLSYDAGRNVEDEEIKFAFLDEVHEVMTQENSSFLKQNKFKYMVGVTATPKEHVKYGRFTKATYFKRLCPIVFNVSLKDAKRLGLQRKVIFYHFMSYVSHEKIYKVKGKQRSFVTSEAEAYSYWNNKITELEEDHKINGVPDYFNKLQELRLLRKKVLYGLPSKAIIFTRRIMPALEGRGKTIVFANSLDLLRKCQIKHILKGGDAKQKRLNQEYIDMFNDGEINILGSYKIIEQGENLKEFDNMVILSYNSKHDQFIQRIGRARYTEKPLHLIIHSIKGTVEMNTVKALKDQLTIIRSHDYELGFSEISTQATS